MTQRWIDMRSDTVTRPTAAMYQAMFTAELGDDVFGEDPSVNRLEAEVAELLGKPSALFVPSGTMANQIAIRVHTRPGDELFCEATAHIHLWEGGGPAMLSGVTCRLLTGERGILARGDFERCWRSANVHYPHPRLVCLENTHNRGGGSILPWENLVGIHAWAREHQLLMHLDGARLMNAVVATGIPARQWAEKFDSVSLCFSKGLGAPVGSALLGSNDFIDEARRVRKVFGGGMRQAGVLAAACRHALQHHVERLAEDHHHARLLANVLAEKPGLRLNAEDVETNLLWIETDPARGTAAEVVDWFRERGVLAITTGPHVLRFCTHLDVSRSDMEHVLASARAFPGL